MDLYPGQVAFDDLWRRMGQGGAMPTSAIVILKAGTLDDDLNVHWRNGGWLPITKFWLTAAMPTN